MSPKKHKCNIKYLLLEDITTSLPSNAFKKSNINYYSHYTYLTFKKIKRCDVYLVIICSLREETVHFILLHTMLVPGHEGKYVHIYIIF